MNKYQLSPGMNVETLDGYEIEFKNTLEIKTGDELTIIKYSDDDPGWVYCKNIHGLGA